MSRDRCPCCGIQAGDKALVTELLEVLLLLQGIHPDDYNELCTIMDKADVAIAKAKGVADET